MLSEDIYICRDKDDNLAIETAIKGHAEFLVTRDDDIKFDKEVSSFLLRYGITVISLSKFIAIIDKS
ncbi:MAG: putative toxin-antitoxin system toxin component, PIN family [Nitrospinae bacterium RIFCSPLOWO2_01_FULL_39_10]|nr:MAG: putative toxin-antitoxin system toxin component, PIN family [Nitrospinae bacterium RIFCSPLOWO2_01_FULL_39_10]